MNADVRLGNTQVDANNGTYYHIDKLHLTLDGYAAAGSVIRGALASLGIKVAGRMGASPGLLSASKGLSNLGVGQFAGSSELRV